MIKATTVAQFGCWVSVFFEILFGEPECGFWDVMLSICGMFVQCMLQGFKGKNARKRVLG